MPERVVSWKAIVDFSRVRREFAKTETSARRLQDRIDELNSSNERLSASQDDSAKNAAKNSQQASSAYARIAQAQRAAREETDKSAASQRAEAKASREASVEHARSAKALQAEIAAQKAIAAASQRLTTARNDQQRATERLGRAENDLARLRAAESSEQKDIEAGERRVIAAREHEARTIDKVSQSSRALEQSQSRLGAIQASNAFEAQKNADAVAKASERVAAKAEEAAARQERADARRSAADARLLQQTILRNNRLRQEYERISAAREAAEGVQRTPTPNRGFDEAALTAARNAISSRPEALQTRTQVDSANALTRAENALRSAVENERSAYTRAFVAAQNHAVALSAVRLAEEEVAKATEHHNAVSNNSASTELQIAQAEAQRVASVRNLERAQISASAAATSVVRAEEAVRVAGTRAENATSSLSTALRRVGRDFNVGRSQGNAFSRVFGGIIRGLDGMDKGITKAAGKLHGLFWPGLFVGAALLVASLSALVSGLFALASAVGPAVGALAAAIPVAYSLAGAFGAVRLAFSGIKGVLQAYAQEQQKQATSGTSAAKKELSNAEAIRSAQKSLKDARENVGITAHNVAENIADAARQVVEADRSQIESQRQLDQARKDAQKNINDLKNAVIDAALAEKGAMLDVADAQDNLQRVLNDPNASRADRERAQLQVDVAKQSATEAARSTRDSESQARQAVSRGVEGDTNVVQARQAVADASYAAAKAQRDYNDALVDGARENRKAIEAVKEAQHQLVVAQKKSNDATDAGTNALETYNYKLSKLSPAAQQFVKKLISMKTYLNQLKATAGANLFPGLTKGLDRLVVLFPVINSGIGTIAKAAGTLGEDFANMITTPAWINSFKQLNSAAGPILAKLGAAALTFADTFRIIGVAAIPLAQKLATGFAQWATNLNMAADAGARSGKLTKFLGESYRVLHQLGQIAKNVITTVLAIGGVAKTSGQSLLDSIQAITAHWVEWTTSKLGQGKLRTFFAQVRTNLRQVDGLLGDLAGGFLKLGASKQLSPIIKGLRDIGSAIKDAFTGTGGAGGALAVLLENIADIIRSFTQYSAGFKIFVGILNGFATVVNTLLGFDIGGFKPLAAGLGLVLGAFAIFKAVKFVGFITGLSGLTRALKGFRLEARQTGGVTNTLRQRMSSLPGAGLVRRIRRGSGGPSDDSGGGGTPTGGGPRPSPTPPSGGGRTASSVRRRASRVARGASDPTGRIVQGTNRRLGLPPEEGTPVPTTGAAGVPRVGTSESGRVVLRGNQSINLRTGQVTNTPEVLPGSGARPRPGPLGDPLAEEERARGGLRGRIPRGDAGFLNLGEVRRPSIGSSSRLRRFGRGAAAGAAGGLAVAGLLAGDLIGDGRGGARDTVGGVVSGAATGALIGASFGPVGAAVGALSGGILALLQNSKIRKAIGDWFTKTVFPFFKALPGKIVDWAKDLLHWILYPFEQAGKFITQKLGPLSTIIKTIFGGIVSYFKGVFTFLKDLFSGVFNIIKGIVTGNFGLIWKGIKQIFGGIIAYLKGAITYVGSIFKAGFTVVKAVAQVAWKAISDVIVQPIKTAFQEIMKAWNIFWSGLKGAWNLVKTTAKSIWSGIANVIGGALGGVGKALSTAWQGIENIFSTAVNFVTQKIINPLIGAINWVITKFGLDPIKKIGAIGAGSASTPNLGGGRSSHGRATTAAEGNVLPGYSPGSDTRRFVDQHGYRLNLSGGEGILTPETTRALGGKTGIDALNATYSSRLRQKPRFKRALRATGMSNYADGGATLGTENQKLGYNTWVLWRTLSKLGGGDLLGEDILSKVGGSLVGLIRKGLAYVVKAGFLTAEAPIRGLVDLIPGGISFFPDLMNGFFDTVNKSVFDFIAGNSKKKQNSLNSEAKYSGVIQNKDAQNDIMASGLVLNNKVPAAFVLNNAKNARNDIASKYSDDFSALRTIISNESGWNSSAVNRTDINAKEGHPSQGLMQTIASTFAAYHNPNFNRGILDPVANVTAGVGYADARYGGLQNVPGVITVGAGLPYVGYSQGGVVQNFHSGGVVANLNRNSPATSAMSGLIAQAGIGFPAGLAKWPGALTTLIRKRLSGVSKSSDVIHPNAYPYVQALLSGDSTSTLRMMRWVDANDPSSYSALWHGQPVGHSDRLKNRWHANPLLPILSYLGNSGVWNNYRKKKEAAYWVDRAKNDKSGPKGTKHTVASEKKAHPSLVARFAREAAKWKHSVGLVSGAANTQTHRIAALRKRLGLTGAGNNSGMFSDDMQNPLDHAMAHALGIQHPADWQHPWAGPVTAVEAAEAQQDRSNALNTEWTNDLNVLANWGLSNLVDYLLDKGITDGLSIARSAVKDRKTATELDKSIAAGADATTAGSPSAQILQIIAKLASGSKTKPFGLRDVSSYLNVPDYAVVNLFDQMVKQLKKLPTELTSKFISDVDLFRKGLFYANTGALVPGDMSQNRDVVPAMLTPGEGVLNRMAMAMLGPQNLSRLNSGIPPQFLNSGGIALAPQLSTPSIGSLANAVPNGRRVTSGQATYAGPPVVNLNTNIYNPTGENSVYTMNRNLRRQSALGVVQKAAGA